MAKSRARKLADIIVGAGIDIDGNLTFDGGSTSADLTFADGDKANFGDASDLQIYHDGSASYIKEAGTGDFIIQGSNTLRLQGSSSQELANFGTGGAVTLFHNNSVKLATTSTGVDVTGTTTTDGLTVDDGTNGVVQFGPSNTRKIAAGSDYGGVRFYSDSSHALYTNNTQRLVINSGGDISFYEDTGTTAKLFWDSSAESLGIGTTSPSRPLDVLKSGSSGYIAKFRTSTNALNVYDSGSSANGIGIGTESGQSLRLFTNDTLASGIAIASSGNVGIGTTSPGVKFDVIGAGAFRLDGSGSTTPLILRNNNTSSVQAVKLGFDSGGAIKSSINAAVYGNDYMTFNVGSDTERMRIDSSGDLIIGGTSSGANDAVSISNTGYIQAIINGDTAAYFNRRTSDGEIVRLQKDGATVGSIANDSTSLVVTGSSTGLKFGTAAIWPTSGGGVTNSNAAKDLGASTAKFKDFYLNGYAYVGALKTNASIESVSNLTFWVANVGEAARIEQGTGNIGVGTSAPSFSAVNSVSSGIKGIEIFKNGTDTASALKLAGDNGSGTKAFAQIGYSGANATAHFANYNTSGTKVGEIVIGSTGLVAIGTSSPVATAQLTIGGTSRIAPVSGNGLLFAAGGSDRMFLNTSGNLSIGNTNGNSTLDLTKTSDTGERAIRIENSSARLYVGVEGSSGNRFSGSSANNGFIGTTTDDGLEFGTANVVRAVITNTGNVGIGVSDPDVRLEVSGSARFAQENHAWTFDDTINNRLGFVKQSGSYSMLASAANTPIIFATSNNSNLQSSVSGQTLYERMRVNYNGNVGIGTSSPSHLLHISKSTYDTTLLGLSYSSSDSGAADYAHYGELLIQGGGTYNKAGIRGYANSYQTGNAALAFWTQEHGGSYAERLRIMGDGQVRIDSGSYQRPIIESTNWGYSAGYRVALLGSSSTTYGTAGTGSITLSMGYDPSSNTDGSFTGDGREILFRRGAQFVTPNSADDDFYLYNLVLRDGKVGIGTAPSYQLHVTDTKGDVAYIASSDPDGNGATNGRVLHVRDNYATSSLDSYVTTGWTSSPGQDVYIGKRTTSGAGYLAIKNSSGTELFTIDMVNGYVGINKTSGFTTGGFTAPRLVIKQTANSVWGGINIESSADDSILALGATDTAHYIASSYRASGGYKPLVFQTGGTERMRIDTSGNVGIGVSSIPSWANLMTHGTVAVGGVLYIKDSQKIQGLTGFPGAASQLILNPDGGAIRIGDTDGIYNSNATSYIPFNTSGKFVTISNDNGAFLNLQSESTGSEQIGAVLWTNRTGASDAHRQIASIDVVTVDTTNSYEGGTMRFYTKIAGSANTAPAMLIQHNSIVKTSNSEFLGFEDAINILNADPEDGGSDFDQTPTDLSDGGQTYWSISNDGDAIYFSSTSGGHGGTWMHVYCDAGLWAIKGSVRLTNTDGAVHGSTSPANYVYTHSFRFYIDSGPDSGTLKWDADTAASTTGTDFTRAAFSGTPVYMGSGYKTIKYQTNGYNGVQQIYITDLQLVKVG